MKEVGRNDPCPCGSGKKYKKCCLEIEDNFDRLKRKLDNFYALIKGYNDELLEKANIPNYIGANFTDALDLTITSNALSLIKAVLQNNHYSITNALNLRNLIECFTLIAMDEKGDISNTQKELFAEQYKLIEYESYAKDDKLKYKDMLDFEDLKLRFDSGKEKFLKIVPENKLKKIINSRLPFLCDEKINYNSLIEKYSPKYLDYYIYLSQMVHPQSYDVFRDDMYYKNIYLFIMELVMERYKNKNPAIDKSSYYDERNIVYGFGIPTPDNYSLELYNIQNRQSQILKDVSNEIKKMFGNEVFIANFLQEVDLILRDINTDSQLGYSENVKLKFKVIAEMFACFNRVFSFAIIDDPNYFYRMSKWHDVVKRNQQLKEEITDDENDIIYNEYLNAYPTSKLTKEKFFKEFNKQIGFLVDEEGHTPNLVELVDEYFGRLFKDELMPEKKIKIKDFYKMVYKESNNMSHGCGYLFFANIGAWMDDKGVLQFLDGAILNFLRRVENLYGYLSTEDETYKRLSDLLKKSIDEMKALTERKTKILKEVPNIPKSF